ncbi:MAG TPA: hypothetical protein VHP99_12345, partial [Pyrinomonadaceae bacterium]|nr:hypothetical protein [Pyrinomonadaceae bacterium]
MASRRRFSMLAQRMYIKLSIVLALASVALFTTSAFGQSPANKTNSNDKVIAAAAQEPRLGNSDNKVTAAEPNAGSPEKKVAGEKPKGDDLKDEIDAVKAENAAVRDQLRKMEEQQKVLLEYMERLQRRLDGNTATDASLVGKPSVAPATADASVPAANAVNTPPAAANPTTTAIQPVPAPQANPERYQQGIVIWQTPDDAKVPFLL